MRRGAVIDRAAARITLGMPKHRFSELFRTRNVLLAAALLCSACGSNSDDETAGAAGSASGGASAGSPSNAGGPPNAGSTSSAGSSGAAVAGSNAGGNAPSAGAPGAGAAGATAGAGGSAGSGTAGSGSAGSGGAPAGDLWLALDGNDNNAGTEQKPLLNLPYALARLAAGHTLFIKAGTYTVKSVVQLKKSGTQAAPFTISAAPGARPVIDFQVAATVRGFDIQGDYWHLLGFEVKNAADNCIAISGSNNTIENLTIHGCGDTGLQITVGSSQVADATRGADNLVLNTDSYENFDSATGGENADGFAAKLRIGAGNVFRGCRAYNNADDGWDLFAADDVVVIESCWAFSNGKASGGNNPAGDGNGFKLGGKPTSEGEGGAVHLVKSSFAFDNLTCGYTQNSNPDVPKLSGCGAKDNKTDYCQTLSKSGEVSMTMTAAEAKAAKRAADGSLPPMK